MGFWSDMKANFWRGYYERKARLDAKEREAYQLSVDCLAKMMRMDAEKLLGPSEAERLAMEAVLRDIAEQIALREAQTDGKVH